jgi:hypothetical protein
VTGDYIRQLQLTKQLEQRAREAALNRKAAEERIAEAEKVLASAKEFAAQTTEAEKLLVESTNSYSSKDYKGALGLAAKSIESSELAKKDKINSIIASAEDLIKHIHVKDKDAEDIFGSIGRTKSLMAEGKISDALLLANTTLDKADQFVNRKIADSFGRAQSLTLLAEGVGLKMDSERQILSEARRSLDESQYGASIKQLGTCLVEVTGSLRTWINSTVNGVTALRAWAGEIGADFSRPDGLLRDAEDTLRKEDYEEAVARVKVADVESKNVLSKALLSAFESMEKIAQMLRDSGADVSRVTASIGSGKDSSKAINLTEAMEVWKDASQEIAKIEEDQFLARVSRLRPKMLIAKKLNVEMKASLEVLDSSKAALREGDFEKAVAAVAEADGLLEKSLKGYREVEKELAKTKKLVLEGSEYSVDMTKVKQLMRSSRELLMMRDFKGSAGQLKVAQKELHNLIQANLAKRIMEIEMKSATAMKMGVDVTEEGALLDDIIKTVKEGNYVAVPDIIARCSNTIESKTRAMAEEVVSTARMFIVDYGGSMNVISAESQLTEAVSALRSNEYEKAHELALAALDSLKKEEEVALADRIGEAGKLLDLARTLGSESITLKDKLAKAQELRLQSSDLEALKMVTEVVHFAKSMIKDEMTRSLTQLSRSIASARKSGVEVVKTERLAEDASRAIDRDELEQAHRIMEDAQKNLETTVILYTEIYDRIVEVSDLLEEAATHGRDTSTALTLLTKTKRLFESGRYEEAKGISITCHEETEKIVAPFIASRRIPQIRDLMAISKRINLDVTPVESILANAESQITAENYVSALGYAKEAERLVQDTLTKGISGEIADSKSLLSRAKSSGVDVRSTEGIITKAESLLSERRYSDALRAIELAKNELDQGIVMERKANEQLDKAQSVIADVKAFGVDITPAKDILKQAGTYYRLGRHGIVVELAKKAAEQATQAARSSVQERLNKVEMNYKSLRLEGPDLNSVLRIRDEVVQLLDQRRFKETGALIRTMASEVERVQAQKKQTSKALQDLRKQMEEARKRGLHADKVDALFAKADEKMRVGAFSESFAITIRCGEELRALAEMFDKRKADLDILKKEISGLEAEGYFVEDASEFIKKSEESLRTLDFEKAILNLHRARVATDTVIESMARDRLKDLQATYKTALKLKIDEKSMPSYLSKLVATRKEEIRLGDLAKIRDGMETLRSLTMDKLTKRELELHGRIETAKSTGADVGRSRVLLIRARELIGAKKFEEAISAIDEAGSGITDAVEMRKRYMELRLRCESFLENAKRRGMKADEITALFNEAEAERTGDYDRATQKMEKALLLVEKEVSSRMPDVSVDLDFLEEPAVGRWMRMRVRLQNEGSGDARDLAISMSGDVDVKGLKQMPELRAGEKASINLEILPKSKGTLTVTLNLVCKPSLSDEQCGFDSTFELTVQ